MKRIFPRRTFLFTPGSSLKIIEKVKRNEADSIILDLEDSVSFPEKETARANVVASIPSIRELGKEVIVRINAIQSMEGIRDLIALAPASPDAFMIPKADEKAIIAADMLLTALEEEFGLETDNIKLIPLLETVYGVANASGIVNAASRINGVMLGAEDLTSELEIDRTVTGEEISYARSMLVFAGRARKIDIIDTPFTGVKDPDGLEADVKRAKDMGFTGKSCIHPNQIDTVNRIFSPAKEAVEQAERLIAAYEASVAEGRGACMFEGKMIDAPIAERAKKIIEKGNLINVNINEPKVC